MPKPLVKKPFPACRTLEESMFQHPNPSELPKYDCDDLKLLSPHVHNTSKSAGKVDIPSHLEKRHADYCVRIARDILKLPENKDALIRVSEDRVARRDPILRHMSEADVFTSTYTHLVHPINSLMDLIQPPFPSGGPANRPTGRKVACAAEQSISFPEIATGDSITFRPDMLFYRLKQMALPSLNGGVVDDDLMSRDFAILELKDRGSICAALFERLAKPPTRGPSVKAKLFRQVAQRTSPSNISSYSPVAKCLLRQVVAYALSHRTRYVALFDWDSLVLFDFHKLEINAGDQTPDVWDAGVEVSAIVTVVQNRNLIRPAFFGFLLEAHKKTPLDRKDGP